MHVRVPDPGTAVWIRQQRWTVERARVDRHVVRLDVAHGATRLTFLSPFDRPIVRERPARPVRVRRQRARARAAAALSASHPLDMPMAARDGRLDLWPFQLEASIALLAGVRRVLVADEVGLGKTIQAALAIAELRRRNPSARALVAAPAALVDQWIDELHERFGLDPRRADDTLRGDAQVFGADARAWSEPGVIVGSTDFLKQRHVFDSIPIAAWDLVVVDEAHAVAGDSQRHEACHELASRARAVLLLSATPHAGDASRFDRLCRIGALPSRADPLRVLRRTRRDIGLERAAAIRWPRVGTVGACAHLNDALAAFERTVLDAARGAREPSALLFLSVLRKRAGSTIHALDQSLARRLEWLATPERAFAFDWLQPRLAFEDDAEGEDERTALIAESGLPSLQERTWLRRLRALAAAAIRVDPKVARLRALLARTAEPAVVFTEFRESLAYIERRLPPARTCAVLHGGLSPQDRRDALRRFLDGHASVLIATDVGGQGLNLQARARWVINVDLPWNPARLAQRAGRVDRIGQTRPVHVTNLASAADSAVVAALARRTFAARHALGGDSLSAAAPPAALAMAAAVLTGRPLPAAAPVTPPVAVSTAWRRRARALAAGLARRRDWARCWRGRAPLEGRPFRAADALPASSHTGTPGDVALVLVPVVDGIGDTIERVVVALAAQPSGRHSIDAFERAAAATLAPRLRRLRRIVLGVSARRVATERAVGDHLDACRRPEATQLRLASLGESRAFERARLDTVRAAQALRRDLDALHDAAHVDVGRPVLQLIDTQRP